MLDSVSEYKFKIKKNDKLINKQFLNIKATVSRLQIQKLKFLFVINHSFIFVNSNITNVTMTF